AVRHDDELAVRSDKTRDRVDDLAPHLERQRLDRVNLEHKIESRQPPTRRLKQIGDLELYVRFAMDTLRPFDRRRRDIEPRHLKTEVVQIAGVVADAAPDDERLASVALKAVGLGPLF